MSRPAVVLCHPIGNPFATEAARTFCEADILLGVFTTFNYGDSALKLLINRLPSSICQTLSRELNRRAWVPEKCSVTSVSTIPEIIRILLSRLGVNKQKALVDWVYKDFDSRTSRKLLPQTNIVYAYEDGASQIFTKAKSFGCKTMYDLPIVHYGRHARLMREEFRRYPSLRPSMLVLDEPDAKLQRKDRELELADLVVVPSGMVKESLEEVGFPSEKVRVIPFGAPIELFSSSPIDESKFQALFVGRIGVRKGAHYLIEAWGESKLRNSELLLVGYNEFPIGFPRSLPMGCRIIKGLPRSELPQLFRAASIVVLPSLVEGLPLVILEAMAAGRAVISTAEAGVGEIIDHGVNGIIIPAKNTRALSQALTWCAAHPAEVAEMGKRARVTAEMFSWSRYRGSILAAATDLHAGVV